MDIQGLVFFFFNYIYSPLEVRAQLVTLIMYLISIVGNSFLIIFIGYSTVTS